MAKNALFASFRYAFKGLKLGFKERNFKLHFVSTIAVLFLGFYFEVNPLEWVILILCIGLVLGFELMNSALEKLTDLVSPEIHPIAGAVKDLAAAAVLIASIAALIIASIIFLPYFFI